ncbi:hypothetical protein K504DRAFT_452770 [Pleomassaria siparia CBS 279.74]|uniref:Uncharacterized protein n=1 Tax=Pleomassaria siparia CBS 279.74 TaxID=1314801 RepID=A0A6G1KI68_9PLEO|nr:hypothetical protein K504DRAFT_452770 [Pleomassaria siparia CBS 279.74]
MSGFHYLSPEDVGDMLDTMDPQSLYICLQVSTVFRQHALASTGFLHRQIARIPGQRILPPHAATDANALMIEFERRAAQHLLINVSCKADMNIWVTGMFDEAKTTLVRWGDYDPNNSESDGLSFNNHLVLIKVAYDSTIDIYLIHKSGDEDHDCRPRLKSTISLHSLHEQLPTCDQHGTQCEVIKVAPCQPDAICDPMVAVLYAPLCDCHDVHMKLLVIQLDPNFGPKIVESFNIERSQDDVVVAMAMLSRKEAVIVVHTVYALQRLIVYRIEEDEVTSTKRTKHERRMPIPLREPPHNHVSSISVHDRTVNLYPTTLPMPYWSITSLLPISNDDIHEEVVRRDVILPDRVHWFLHDSLGRIIHEHHQHHVTVPDVNAGTPALELMISHEQSATVSRSGAFLLKVLHLTTACRPFDKERHYRDLPHKYVAKLAGLPDLNSISHVDVGMKVAFSPKASRIAIALWRTVRIWPLDPDAFLDQGYSLSGAPGVPGDHFFFTRCGWEFYRPNRIINECVILEPVELPCSGIVFDLQFRGEDELWASTDVGPTRWNFGVDASGIYTEEAL